MLYNQDQLVLLSKSGPLEFNQKHSFYPKVYFLLIKERRIQPNGTQRERPMKWSQFFVCYLLFWAFIKCGWVERVSINKTWENTLQKTHFLIKDSSGWKYNSMTQEKPNTSFTWTSLKINGVALSPWTESTKNKWHVKLYKTIQESIFMCSF